MNLHDIPPSTWHELRRLALAAGKRDVADAIETLLWAPGWRAELRQLEPGVWQAINDHGRAWRFSSVCWGLGFIERLLAGERIQIEPGQVEMHRLAVKRAYEALRDSNCSRLAAYVNAALALKRDGRVIFTP